MLSPEEYLNESRAFAEHCCNKHYISLKPRGLLPDNYPLLNTSIKLISQITLSEYILIGPIREGKRYGGSFGWVVADFYKAGMGIHYEFYHGEV